MELNIRMSFVFLFIINFKSSDCRRDTNDDGFNTYKPILIEPKRPNKSNIRIEAASEPLPYYNIFDSLRIKNARYKRSESTRSDLFSHLRKLNEGKKTNSVKRDEEMPADAKARMEPNYTGLPPRSKFTNRTDFADINLEQENNKQNNKMRQLFRLHNSEKQSYVFTPGLECNFEVACNWKWKTDIPNGFVITSRYDGGANDVGPQEDADNSTKGHFLFLKLNASTKEMHVTSPLFEPTSEGCRLQLWLYQESLGHGGVRIVVDTINHTQWVVGDIHGDDKKRWKRHTFNIGKISQNFNIILEAIPPKWSANNASLAFDNIKLIHCFAESAKINSCTPKQFRCSSSNVCINNTELCDITRDCDFGDDEAQNCDKIPFGARCNFEEDWCGWHNSDDKVMQWSRHNGSTPTNKTGPDIDHTYRNSTGKYMLVNMAQSLDKGVGFASSAVLYSVIFNPPPKVHGNASSPYYNSCSIRFFYHQYGAHKSGFLLAVTEMGSKENTSKDIFWSFADHGDIWRRSVVTLPNITDKYYLQFEARKGIRLLSDLAIDDFSMSPECFGLNIPQEELNGYNYWNPYIEHAVVNEPHMDFINETFFEVSTCGIKGKYGPSQENCTHSYKNTTTKVKVMHEPGLVGVQKWIAPQEGFYTVILFGASGGKGSTAMGSSRGAMVKTVLELYKGQELYILVGQEGTPACVKTLGYSGNTSCKSLRNEGNLTGIRGVFNMELQDGGGGGGGATFLFLRNRTRQAVPIAVAAGGGGLGLGRFIDTGIQHGQGINMSHPPTTGDMCTKSAGAGAGWELNTRIVTIQQEKLMGQALLSGASGGEACYPSTDGRGNGGFGGGGGGCIGGGGGGGYSGGKSCYTYTTNGEGGYSFIDPNKTMTTFSEARSGQHSGPGSVLIIPAIPGCECDYRCLALDPRRSKVACICPKKWKLAPDAKACLPMVEEAEDYPTVFIIVLMVIIVFLLLAFAVFCFLLYNRYQQRTTGLLRHKMMSGPDLPLNRLRIASDSMMTEYNPNYEFGGVVYTLRDLKDIPRDQLRLVKALGQGAFGEVYQGFYRQRSGDAVEMPVAVKTLPEMSTNQAEIDFLMEALIMAKFNHPNIVHFIGVCFDKHPRFIVLELLAGGDLKNFLREARPKPGRSSPLAMKDLVLIAIDVVKGCKYMEDNRFIHRDIAARNCLLTTKGPGRVVKIADFGMSRDVYRSDYYRKGGKAMLPIKWMPPEAFLDGIFTSKTDVWSFGVLLWEILSMGYMPYTGCANREVMQLVTNGGRLGAPPNCPDALYGIMTQCWHPYPEQRPTFGLLLERLGYCTQDPQVMKAALPVFNRLPSQERDATVMRPTDTDDSYLQLSNTADYLIPTMTTTDSISMTPSACGSNSSIDKMIANSVGHWETSFVMPHSKSTQPLLQENNDQGSISENVNMVDKLISIDTPDATIQPQTSPITLPNNMLSNHNNNVNKTDLSNNLKTGLSLDAGALAKQSMTQQQQQTPQQPPPPQTQKKPYANINGGETLTANGIIQNGPYSIQNQANSVFMNNTSKFLNEAEISC